MSSGEKFGNIDFRKYPGDFGEAANALWELAASATDQDDEAAQRFTDTLCRLHSIATTESGDSLTTDIHSVASGIVAQLEVLLTRRYEEKKEDDTIFNMLSVVVQTQIRLCGLIEPTAEERARSTARAMQREEYMNLVPAICGTLESSEATLSDLRRSIDEGANFQMLFNCLVIFGSHCENFGHQLPADLLGQASLLRELVMVLRVRHILTENQYQNVQTVVSSYRLMEKQLRGE